MLGARGLIVRSRRGDDDCDATLKLRGPEGCLDIPQWSRRTDGWTGAKLEGDWAGSKKLISASLGHKLDADQDGMTDPKDPADVIALLPEAQADLAREWMIPLSTLDLLGPIAAQKWSNVDFHSDLDCDVEIWEVDELRFLKISTRAKAEDALETQRALHHSLVRLGVAENTMVGTTKTETVIRHLM